MTSPRSTDEVLQDHLRLRAEGKLEEDLARNYAPQVVLLTSNSNMSGHAALRKSASRLRKQLPEARFNYRVKQVQGPYALLIWSATSSRFEAVQGADSFVIENGKITFQSIHYALQGIRQGSPP
ncbi:nuclear transport factor 2 family protein [Pseudorhizobium flavum]|uniref:nuclear transport factor 2 family protein n=1 Tax=Pseudorhizobium flavum TaxID=1335061 RepID=UPI00376FC2BE